MVPCVPSRRTLAPLLFLFTLVAAGLAPSTARAAGHDLDWSSGGAMVFDITPSAPSGYWGFSAGVAVRWRKVLELRLDGATSSLLPRQVPGRECGEPPCFAGFRTTLTPSIGARIYLGRTPDYRRDAIFLTPSIGYVLGAQLVDKDDRTPPYELNAPAGWTRAAPGLTLGMGPGDFTFRMFLPRGAFTSPAFLVSVGLMI